MTLFAFGFKNKPDLTFCAAPTLCRHRQSYAYDDDKTDCYRQRQGAQTKFRNERFISFHKLIVPILIWRSPTSLLLVRPFPIYGSFLFCTSLARLRLGIVAATAALLAHDYRHMRDLPFCAAPTCRRRRGYVGGDDKTDCYRQRQ